MNYMNEIDYKNQIHHNDKLFEAMRFSATNNPSFSSSTNNAYSARGEAILSDRTSKHFQLNQKDILMKILFKIKICKSLCENKL